MSEGAPDVHARTRLLHSVNLVVHAVVQQKSLHAPPKQSCFVCPALYYTSCCIGCRRPIRKHKSRKWLAGCLLVCLSGAAMFTVCTNTIATPVSHDHAEWFTVETLGLLVCWAVRAVTRWSVGLASQVAQPRPLIGLWSLVANSPVNL